MNEQIFCPVPTNQIPVEQFKELNEGWFYSMPKRNLFGSTLLISWIILVPISFYIVNSDWHYRNDIFHEIIISSLTSLSLPFILILRQLLGWNYVYRRLISNKIEYEETGWYDGQSWQKSISARSKDLLIAEFEVKPIIIPLKRALIVVGVIMVIGLYLCSL